MCGYRFKLELQFWMLLKVADNHLSAMPGYLNYEAVKHQVLHSVLCREPSCRPQDGWLRSGTGTRKLGRHEPSSANMTAWRPPEDGLYNPSYLFVRILFKVLRLVITTLHSQRTSIQSAIGRPAVILSLVIKSISAMHNWLRALISRWMKPSVFTELFN